MAALSGSPALQAALQAAESHVRSQLTYSMQGMLSVQAASSSAQAVSSAHRVHPELPSPQVPEPSHTGGGTARCTLSVNAPTSSSAEPSTTTTTVWPAASVTVTSDCSTVVSSLHASCVPLQVASCTWSIVSNEDPRVSKT